MKKMLLLACGVVLLSLAANRPASAQILEGMAVTTQFPFYAGNTKLPAGTYIITQADMENQVLLIQRKDGTPAAFIDFIPTESPTIHNNTDASFVKYGDDEYLDRLWVAGQTYGMKVTPEATEQRNLAFTVPAYHTPRDTGN